MLDCYNMPKPFFLEVNIWNKNKTLEMVSTKIQEHAVSQKIWDKLNFKLSV